MKVSFSQSEFFHELLALFTATKSAIKPSQWCT